MYKVLFNRTLGKMAARAINTRGSMGKTIDTWSLGSVSLSTSSQSNYSYEEAVEGDWRHNCKLLKAAPVGTVLVNEYYSSWAGHETEESRYIWTKGVDGAWHLNK